MSRAERLRTEKPVAQPVGGPYRRDVADVGGTMRLVALALVPATLFGVAQFGWPAANLIVVTVATAVLTEAACLRLAGRSPRAGLGDGSALVTGLILALTLPPWAPWWIGVVGSVTAIGLGKQVFGGLGQNPFNPAMVARVALLIAFPLELTQFPPPPPFGAAPGFLQGLTITFGLDLAGAPAFDALSGASVLGGVKTALAGGADLATALADQPGWLLGLAGREAGSLGETSAALILLGGVILLATRVITWHIPVALIATLAALAALGHALAPDRLLPPEVHILSGATLFGAVFIATDPVTSPVTPRGQLLFGAGCAVLIYVIRSWAGYPEGMAFAILLMNACTPVIDRTVRPRVFGRTRAGTPLPVPPAPAAPSAGQRR